MNSPDEDLARVTVMSPTRRVDLALPGSVTLGELLPSILRFSGYEGGTPQEAVHGWVLQRFGDDPLDPNQVITKLAIRDGETLYLRPREGAMPDAAFDDVVDAVSVGVATRPSWRSEHSQIYAIAAMLVILVGIPTVFMITQSINTPIGKRGILGAVLALAISFAAGIGSVALSRAANQYRVAAALAWGCVALAGIGGWQLLDTPDVPARMVLTSALVLAASAACALAASVTVMGLFTVAVTAGIALIAAIASALIPGATVDVAAIGLTILLAMTVALPTISYQLARIQLPNLPSSADALMADEEPVQSDIVQRAILADRLLAALLTASSVAMFGFSVILIRNQGQWAIALVLAVGLAMLMRARTFIGLSQRLALLTAGSLLTAMAAITLLSWIRSDLVVGLIVGLLVIIATVILAYYATTRYNKIIPPQYGRLGDITEWLSIMAVLPLLLGVLNTYGWIQSLFHGG